MTAQAEDSPVEGVDERDDLRSDSSLFVDLTGRGERCSEEVDIDALVNNDDQTPDVEVVPSKGVTSEATPPDPVVPTRWAPSRGRQCHRYSGRMVCEGPRRVPEPHGEAAERALALGLGRRQTAGELLRGPPRPEWLDALGPDDEDEPSSLHWPVDGGLLWRHFGRVRHRGRHRIHKGVDIGGPYGSLIRSVRRGLVAYSDNGVSGYGNIMLIVHADATTALYAHTQANYVFAGQFVVRGQAIGEVGSTGLAYGAHLHFELRKNGQAINPYTRFEGKAEGPVVKRRRRARRRAAKRRRPIKRENQR